MIPVSSKQTQHDPLSTLSRANPHYFTQLIFMLFNLLSIVYSLSVLSAVFVSGILLIYRVSLKRQSFAKTININLSVLFCVMN